MSAFCSALLVVQALAATDYSAAIDSFAKAALAEIGQGNLSGISVAFVDDRRLVYAGGFGWADKSRRVRARHGTVYRAGSISKLFTALAAMQLSERGRLDIDAPLARYMELGVVNPFPGSPPLTLRQLMCHRSGMIRESPVGGYLDDSEPGLDRTIASLSGCVLVHPPNTKTKYSNSGVSVVGGVVESMSSEPFEEYQTRHLLDPIGMTNSAFRLTPELKRRLATGYLSVAQRDAGFKETRAPHHELGAIPAGNLYTTCEDLGRFLSVLFAGGYVGEHQLIKPETLKEMWTVQLTGETNGFGLGFYMNHHHGRRTFGHRGAVYGFTSIITGLADEKLGLVLLCNEDLATATLRRLNALGLDLMLEAKFGQKPPAPPARFKIEPGELSAFAGDYESESYWASIQAGDGVLRATVSRQFMILAPVEPTQFLARGRFANDAPCLFERNASGEVTGFTALGQKFRRVDGSQETEIPAEWKRFLGSYGPKVMPLIVTARRGHLYAMIENEYAYRLTPLNRVVFKLPPGLYEDEHVIFQTDKRGQVHTALFANMSLRRLR